MVKVVRFLSRELIPATFSSFRVSFDKRSKARPFYLYRYIPKTFDKVRNDSFRMT